MKVFFYLEFREVLSKIKRQIFIIRHREPAKRSRDTSAIILNMQEKEPCVYILTNKRNGTLYVGVTSNIRNRVYEHKSGVVKGFTSKYKIHTLVYLEGLESMEGAILR